MDLTNRMRPAKSLRLANLESITPTAIQSAYDFGHMEREDRQRERLKDRRGRTFAPQSTVALASIKTMVTVRPKCYIQMYSTKLIEYVSMNLSASVLDNCFSKVLIQEGN